MEPLDETITEYVSSDEEADTARNGLVITATSPLSGSGKSSVAVLLSITLAQASKKAFDEGLAKRPLDIVLVDLDISDGQLGFVMGQMSPTVLDFYAEEDISDPSTLKRNLAYNDRMGIHALLAPKFGRPTEFLDPKFYKHAIQLLKTMFDVVIIDTSVDRNNALMTEVAIPEADAILMVTKLNIRSMKSMARWINILISPRSENGHEININNIGVVVNQEFETVGVEKEALLSATLGAPLLATMPIYTISPQSGSSARGIDEHIKHPAIGSAYFKLAKRIAKPRGFDLVSLIDDNNNK